jgi:hypothetical protein
VTNPYEPPRSNLRLKNTEPGSIPKAVAVGVAIDISGTLLIGFAAALIYGGILGARGYDEEAIAAAFQQIEPWSLFGIITGLLGLAISSVAGFHCARIANRNGYLAPGIMAMISCAFGAALSSGVYSQLVLLVLSALSVVAVLGGAALYVRGIRSG